MKNLFLSLFVLLCIGCTTVGATAQIDDCVEVYTEADIARLGVPTYYNNVIVYYTLGGYRYYPYYYGGYRYYRYRPHHYYTHPRPPRHHGYYQHHRPHTSYPSPYVHPQRPQTRPGGIGRQANVGRPSAPAARPNTTLPRSSTRPSAGPSTRSVGGGARPGTFSGGSRRGR